MKSAIANFYAGPGKLPVPVLDRIARELRDFQGTGLSVMEISHRAPPVIELIERVIHKIKNLLHLDAKDEVLLLQGGGSLQFLMAPLNLSKTGEAIDYVDTGYWASKAIHATNTLGREVQVIAKDHLGVPKQLVHRPNAKYLHLCTNNTVMGSQWHELPKVSVPLVADASSDFLSRPFDYRQYALTYAHAQKTIGTAGVTVVVMRADTMARLNVDVPEMLSYASHINARSNYHTPPVFAIYVMDCMLDWLIHDVGGLTEMGRINQAKANLLYEFLDHSKRFTCPVRQDSRSQMNIVFDLKDSGEQEALLARAEDAGILGLAGHRARGGLRASLYNAVTYEEVERLVQFLETGKPYPPTKRS